MPLYRTKPDVSLDDLIQHLEWVGEPIIMMHRTDEEWVVLTQPAPRLRPTNVYINTSQVSG